jgi:peptidoglycan/LPS O-acetylase OafA/YrhL
VQRESEVAPCHLKSGYALIGGSQLEYRADIDGLRAIAVLSVVLFHFGWTWFPGGFLGVDIFFVISGYLITRLLQAEILSTGRVSFSRFYLRRARRLLPALGVVLAGTSIWAVMFLSPMHLAAFGKELASAALSLSNVLFLKQSGYFETNALLKPLLHTWSLAVEEQFYLVWPVVMLVAYRWGTPTRTKLLAVGALASLVGAQVAGRDAAFYLPWFRFFEFAAGAALVRLDDFRSPSARTQFVLLPIGLAAMLLPILLYSEHTRLPGLRSIIPVAGAALTIYAGRAPYFGRILSNPLSVWIGRCSYSIYLVHWPVLVFFALATHYAPLGWAGKILLPIAVIAIAALIYYAVETPVRTMKPGPQNRRFAWQAGGVAITFVAVGSLLNASDGMPWRLPPDVAKLALSPHRKVQLGECEYASEVIDEVFLSKFQACVDRHGPATLIFGDSHAGDLFHALASASTKPHVVGVWRGGCRLNSKKECYWADFPEFVSNNRVNFSAMIYTQSGLTLLSEDSPRRINRAAVALVSDKLDDFASSELQLIWVGPQEEPNFSIERAVASHLPPRGANYFENQVAEIHHLDDTLKATPHRAEYVSKIDAIGPLSPDTFVFQGEYTYSDEDHWSANGEELFGRLLLEHSEALATLLGS